MGLLHESDVSKREFLTADEVMALDSSLEILLRQGQAPVIAQKVRYFADSELRSGFGFLQ